MEKQIFMFQLLMIWLMILSSVLIVTPVNDAIFPGMPDLVVDEDNTLAIQLSATDVDGDYLTYSTEPVEHMIYTSIVIKILIVY